MVQLLLMLAYTANIFVLASSKGVEKDILIAVKPPEQLVPVALVSEPTSPDLQIPTPVKFSKDVEKDILDALDQCVNSSAEKYSLLLAVKNGKCLPDQKFKDFIFCSYTKSGYADTKTGRVFIEHAASIYPSHCNVIEVLKKCDKLVRHRAPVAALYDFFVCFQKNTPCLIDLLPADPPNTSLPDVSEIEIMETPDMQVPTPVKFSKDVEKDILDALDQCVTSSAEKYSLLLAVKNGKCLPDQKFKDFIFCSYTKSGYADTKTGRVFIEHAASIYPSHCNVIEVLKKCDKLVRHRAPVAALYDFFVCFQKNTPCLIDLLPADPPNTSLPDVSEIEIMETPDMQVPTPVKFSKDVEKDILDALDQCVTSSAEKYSLLLAVKNGKCLPDQKFKDFIFCSYTKSGYADTNTGRVFIEHAASIYPSHCNVIEVLKKCDKLVRHRAPVAALYDFFVCFQKNTPCLIDLLPADPPNSRLPDVSETEIMETPDMQVSTPVKFSKDVEKDILDALDQCVTSSAEKYSLLLAVKNGKCLPDQKFKDFIFCSYTKSGYADTNTGRVFIEHAASIYPSHCNVIEVLKKCDKLVRHRAPVAALYDFFVCFQKNTPCLIDLLPADPPNSRLPDVSETEIMETPDMQIPTPVKFSKDVEKDILDALDQCVTSSAEKYSLLLAVKKGKCLPDQKFKDFIFCSYTKSGYADTKTGRVFIEHAASIYPSHCNVIEVLKKCDKLVRHRAPVAALYDFFVCFQKNTPCLIDLLPADSPIPSLPDVSDLEITQNLRCNKTFNLMTLMDKQHDG